MNLVSKVTKKRTSSYSWWVTRERKLKKKATVENCKAGFCVVNHNINVNWVQCDLCEEWFNCICEALTHTFKKLVVEITYVQIVVGLRID